MLFDEKELNVLDNNESRTYFKEILQSYYPYNQNKVGESLPCSNGAVVLNGFEKLN